VNVLPTDRKVAIINGLCNGMSLRAASRVFSTHRTAIQHLLVRVGERCDTLLTDHMRDLDFERLEMDELWTFCGKKQGRLSAREKLDADLGDQYLFFAIDHDTKVVPAWAIGKRDTYTALELLYRLRGSMNGCRPQISTDAWHGYLLTIGPLFGDSVDWATLTKVYDSENPGRGRYAPPKVTGTEKHIQLGEPDLAKVCTSIVERSNLTVRTMQRRFTRLTCAFSRKMENLRAACALHWGYYNFVWQPRTLGGPSPAMAAGATDRLWKVADLVGDC
jgi:IS1 family transposase